MNDVSLGFDWPSANTRLERTTKSIKNNKKLWNKRSGDDKKIDH